jgi:hypothetical protein
MREQETPRRSHQGWDLHRDRDVYGDRDKVECLVGCLKQWRRIAARHEKRAASYLAMLALATFVFDFNCAHTPRAMETWPYAFTDKGDVTSPFCRLENG